MTLHNRMTSLWRWALIPLLVLGCRSAISGDADPDLAWSVDFPQANASDVHLRKDGAIGFTISLDPGGNEYLWFYLEVACSAGGTLEFVLENAARAHQTGNRWKITRPFVSADGSTWVRCAATRYGKESGLTGLFSDPVFRFKSPIAAEVLRVAYFHPYTNEDLHRFLQSITDDPGVRISSLGTSEEGRDIPLLQIDPRVPADSMESRIWIVAREHPGETPASFTCEGMVRALLDEPAGQRLRDAYGFNIVPILNIDGVDHGYYYHNSNGVNLARDWVDFEAAETMAFRRALYDDVEKKGVKLVVNLHASNDPHKGHFFLKISEEVLGAAAEQFQAQVFQAADRNHPQLQGQKPINLLKLKGITGNALYRDFSVYCLYLESNYSRGADGSEVTLESLRQVGSALVQALAEVLRPE